MVRLMRRRFRRVLKASRLPGLAALARFLVALVAGPVQTPVVDTATSREARRVRRFSLRRDDVRRSLMIFTPTAVLALLAVSQASWAYRDWLLISEHPSWIIATEFARSSLYATFVMGGAFILLTNGPANRSSPIRDGRALVEAAALSASFLMIGLNAVPSGPIVWSAPAPVVKVGLVITMIGAALAVAALGSIKSSFSIVPEARRLVVSGPYRLLRHPMYLAELLMLFGVVVGFVRLTTLVGALIVLGLQVYRIQTEERLLRESFPTTFEAFSTRTRFRLIPLLW